MDGEERFKQRLEHLEVEGVGSIGFGVGGIVVDLEEEAVDAGSYGGTGQHGDKLGLSAADAVRC